MDDMSDSQDEVVTSNNNDANIALFNNVNNLGKCNSSFFFKFHLNHFNFILIFSVVSQPVSGAEIQGDNQIDHDADHETDSQAENNADDNLDDNADDGAAGPSSRRSGLRKSRTSSNKKSSSKLQHFYASSIAHCFRLSRVFSYS